MSSALAQKDQVQQDKVQQDEVKPNGTPLEADDAKPASYADTTPTQWNFVDVSANDLILVVGKRKAGRTEFGRKLVTSFGIAGLAATDYRGNKARQPVAECKKAGPDPVDKSRIYARSNQTEMLMKWWKLRKLCTDGGSLNGAFFQPNKDFSAANAAVVLVDDIESIADTVEEHNFYRDLLTNHAAYNVLVVATSDSSQEMSDKYNVHPTWRALLKPSLILPQDKEAVCSALCGPSEAAWLAAINACNFRGAVWYKHEDAGLTTLSFCHGVDHHEL